jgi:uncharacterized protein (TIGR02117 family)
MLDERGVRMKIIPEFLSEIKIIRGTVFPLGITGLLLAGCATQPYIVRDYQIAPTDPKTQTVYAVSHGWHTGIIVGAADLNKQLPELGKRFIDKKYYEVGWGDAEYYQADEPGSGLALQAVLWPGPTVLHLAAFSLPPDRQFPSSRVVKLGVTRNGYRNLLSYIKTSFYANPGGQPVSLKKGLYGDSQFYQATGSFYLFNTCNKWTAKGLASAGLDLGTAWKLTANNVMDAVAE